MVRKAIVVVASGLILIGGAQLQGSSPEQPLYVDCAATLAGVGSRQAPFGTITAAVLAGRRLSAGGRITIEVAAGTCSRETLPILLDYPVDLTGSRLPESDRSGLPTGDQHRDTLITPGPGPVPVAFFVITADGVRVARLSIDGQLEPLPDVPIPPAAAPTGVIARAANDLVLEQLRLVRVAVGVRAEGAGGRVSGNYVAANASGLVFFGGEPALSPTMSVIANRVDYRVNGITLVGGIPPNGPTPAGLALSAVVAWNDLVTRYRNSGPTTPAALRLNPTAPGASEGQLQALFVSNSVRGTPRYSIIVHGGQPQRDASVSSGSVRAVFLDTTLDSEAKQISNSLITFTNARATELPCELNPANGRDVCPSLMGNPPAYWDYHQETVYNLWHSGELTGVLIDHPRIVPIDGRVLDNVLTINGVTVDYQSFVIPQ